MIPVSGASNSFLIMTSTVCKCLTLSQNCVPDFKKKCLSAGKLHQATKTNKYFNNLLKSLINISFINTVHQFIQEKAKF